MVIKSLPSTAFRLLLTATCLLSVVSCTPVPAQRDWTYADLRLLDPLDNTPTPSTDILAVYDRTVGSDLEIRVDLLDIPIIPDYDLSLHLITPGMDPTIFIPASGQPIVTPAQAGIQARIVRDPWLDTVTVRLNRLAIPQPFTLQVSSFIPGSSTPADETAPVRSDAPPPLARAPLLLAFWDTFPVTTPAQALRRWDGAHSGPRGERHGLIHVIEGAALYHIPLVLLDLKTPASLAALNYMGVLPQIQTLCNQGLLVLPDVAYAEPAQVSLGFSRSAAAGFGLPASQFVYSASATLQSKYLAQFISLDDASHLARSADARLIPLPAPADTQATIDGPSLDVRRQLVTVAFSADPSRLVVLGGDLPLSTWGNQDMAAPTFAWLAAHPWIHLLNSQDLLTFPLGSKKNLPAGAGSTSSPVETSTSPFLENLITGPTDPLTVSAWQTWFMLTAPTSDEKLRTLRLNYFGQVGELLAAARWAKDPSAQVSCVNDLNYDGSPECILSSRNMYAVIDPRGGRLSNLFYLDASGPHQLVGPSSQFTVGLSDPSEWHPDLGEAADPTVISGAFNDGPDRWDVHASVDNAALTFTSLDGTRQKTYILSDNGITVTYQGFGPVSIRIPLTVDPQAFYFGPVKYQSSPTPGVWTWGLVNGLQVEVHSNAILSAQNFTDSQSFLPGPENPDQAYPGGHYLPFPLSVVTVQGNTDFSVQITIAK
jgi:hypothetical protein